MQVCNICKSTFDLTTCKLQLVKHYKKNGKSTKRIVYSINLDICESCISPFGTKLHQWKRTLTESNHEKA